MLLLATCLYSLAAVLFYGWLRQTAVDAPEHDRPVLLLVLGNDVSDARRAA